MAQQKRMQFFLGAVDKLTPAFTSIAGASKDLTSKVQELNYGLTGVNKSLKTVEAYKKNKLASVALKNEWQSAEEKVGLLAKGIKDTEKPTLKQRQDFLKAKEAASKLKKQFEKTKDKSIELKSSLKALGHDTSNLSKLTNKLKADKERLTKSIEKETQALKKQNLVAAEKEKKLEKASQLALAGQATKSAGLSILGAAQAPLTTAMNFEQSMSLVEAKAFTGEKDRDKRKKMMEPIKAQALELGASTSFSATDVSGAQAELAGAGLNGKSILGVTEGLLTMAKAGGLALDSAADLSTGLLNMYDMDKSESGIKNSMEGIGDILAKTASDTKTNMAEMAEVFKYAGSGANALGVDLAGTAGLVSALANNNIKASEAGTALRGILSRLAAPTSAAKKELEKLQIQTKDSEGNFRNINTIFEEFAEKTEHLGNTEKARIAKLIAGETAQSGFLALMKEAGKTVEINIKGEKKQISSLKNLSRGYKEAGGYAKRMSDIMSDNTQDSFTQLSSATEGLSISLGSSFAPVAKIAAVALTGLAGAVTGLTNYFPNLTAVIGSTIVVGGGLLVGLGSLGAAMSAAPFIIAGFSSALVASQAVLGFASGAMNLFAIAVKGVTLAFASNPLGMAIAGIAILGAGLSQVITYWDEIEDFASKAGDWFGDLLGGDKEASLGIKGTPALAYSASGSGKIPERPKPLNQRSETELKKIGVVKNQTNTSVIEAPISIKIEGNGDPEAIGKAVKENIRILQDEQNKRHSRRNYD